MSRGSKRSQTLEPVQKSWNFIRRPGKSWEFKKNQKLKIVCSVCFLPDRTKKFEKVTFWKISGKSMFWRVLGSTISLFPKNKNHHLGRASNAKTWNISWNIWFWWALGSVKTIFQRFCFFVCLICFISFCKSTSAQMEPIRWCMFRPPDVLLVIPTWGIPAPSWTPATWPS